MKNGSYRQPPASGIGRAVRWFILLSVLIVFLTLVALGVIGIAVVNQARQDEAAPADAIVVLGTAQWDGRPSTTFRARLDHAYDLYSQGYAELIVLTGGVAPGDVYAEADVGETYLLDRGIPPGHLLSVPIGLNSRESLEAAAGQLQARNLDSVILVSDPFHMFRVKQIASNLGLSALGSPTTTSPIRPGSPAEQHYVVREVFAYVNYLFFDS
jgi:uncharacterized SAM-binding protein YcdF (DUF218 family)